MTIFKFIKGGMWGFKPEMDRNLAGRIFDQLIDPYLIRKYNPFFINHKGGDQEFLRHQVYPLIAHKSLIHDSFHCFRFEERGGDKSWPVKREGGCFVGLPSNSACVKNQTFFKKCPPPCRPLNHPEWLYC